MKINSQTSLTELRRYIHQNPEVSGREHRTAQTIAQYTGNFQPDEIITGIGGTGLAFVFNGQKPGKTVLFRAELDALPIHEINTFVYRSEVDNVGHKCGHDGHMVMVASLARFLRKNPPQKGRVILTFQPAEETGQGAGWYINDPKFNSLQPDYAFALHNLPGFKQHQIVTSNTGFASASKGIIVRLKGKTSHAAEPENGINPAGAVSKILKRFLHLPQTYDFRDFTLLTIIHVKLGEVAFGTSAGDAVVMATLRSYRNDDMEKLAQKAVETAKTIAHNEKLEVSFDWQEEFYATVNSQESNTLIEEAARRNQLDIKRIAHPFRWSEDFSYFTYYYNGAMFGLGAGLNHPLLHNPDYDFPEEIMETGIAMYQEICKQLVY